MFTVKLEVNGTIVQRIEAIRQSDRAYGENRYAVYEATELKRRFLGYVVHVYENGASALAKILIDYAWPRGVQSSVEEAMKPLYIDKS
jgi:hypothetical protein